MKALEIPTPRWAVPHLAPCRYKGAKGGRSGGKSHFFAELSIEEHVVDPNRKSVCIREVQRSLKFSSKALLEQKIEALGVDHLFEILRDEIRSTRGDGIWIFQGMQDHTADSIKSLEGFDDAMVEEANSLSDRSMRLLLPTIRKSGSEIRFIWNPENEEDPVDRLFEGHETDPDMILTHCTFEDNPFKSQEVIKEAARHYKYDPDTYGHVWLGEYNNKTESQIFGGKFKVDEFTPGKDWEPLHGLDFGFSIDPTAGVRCYLVGDVLYIYQEGGGIGLELDQTGPLLRNKIPGIERHVVRADSARPESISYCRRNGLPKIQAVTKWPGSVEDGIEFIRSLKGVVIHPQCPKTADEFRLYSYKTHRQTGEVLPDIIDKHNHYIDAIRYALAPIIQKRDFVFV